MEKTEDRWKDIDETDLTIAERCVYRTRRRAVELYMKGGTGAEILCATGLSRTAVMKLWNRCCAKDPDTGKCCGFWALIPKSKMKNFIR